MEITQELIDRFMVETKSCVMCGSQRCEATPEWVTGCSDFRAWLEKYKSDEAAWRELRERAR